jgi:hypothetical protein
VCVLVIDAIIRSSRGRHCLYFYCDVAGFIAASGCTCVIGMAKLAVGNLNSGVKNASRGP